MNEPSIEIPVSLLLEIYSQANSSIRNQIDSHIRDYKEMTNEKGHVAEGFIKTDDCSLVFDLALYDEAIYRGKISTYAEKAKSEIERLKGSLSLLQAMAETQNKLAAAIPSAQLEKRLGIGKSISDADMQLLSKIRPLLKHDEQA